MNRPPRVSILVATYNHEQYIRECVDSLLAQEYPNLEIVIADDASTDATLSILRDYERAHPDLIKISTQRQNVGPTLNSLQGFRATTGDFVALFAGDDVMFPGKVERQAAYMDANPDVVLCYHDQEIFESDSGEVLGYYNHGPGSSEPREGGAELLIRYGIFCGSSSVMLRRSAIPDPAYDARIPFASDWLLAIETAVHGRIGYIGETLSRWRRHSRGLSRIAEGRIGSDYRITMAIVDERYPQLRRHTRRFRLRYFFRYAVKAVLQHRFGVAAGYFADFLRAVIGQPGRL